MCGLELVNYAVEGRFQIFLFMVKDYFILYRYLHCFPIATIRVLSYCMYNNEQINLGVGCALC